MAEYHVGCGAFGIYAGTVNPPRKDGYQTWRQKSDVTGEAIEAVVQYLVQEMKIKGKTKHHMQFLFTDNALANIDIEIVKKDEKE